MQGSHANVVTATDLRSPRFWDSAKGSFVVYNVMALTNAAAKSYHECVLWP